MMNIITVETAVADTDHAFVAGNFDDGITVNKGVVVIDLVDLTAPQQTIFSTFITAVVKGDRSVTFTNLPYNSDFGVDIITDSITGANTIVSLDYTALSATTKGQIDDFHQLIIDLLP